MDQAARMFDYAARHRLGWFEVRKPGQTGLAEHPVPGSQRYAGRQRNLQVAWAQATPWDDRIQRLCICLPRESAKAR